MADQPAIVWFRDDLRVADNPALLAAAGRPVVPLFIRDDASPGLRQPGAAQKWMLHHGLAALVERLAQLGSPPVIRRGTAGEIIPALIRETGASAVFWNRRYHPAEVAIDRDLKQALTAAGIEVRSFLGNHLHEPSRLAPAGGGFYRVYTPFRNALERVGEPRRPLPAPEALTAPATAPESLALDSLRLLPRNPDWAAGWATLWPAGEKGGRALLSRFLRDGLQGYGEGRDFPSLGHSSRLSPYLRFGMVSPYQVWHAASGDAPGVDIGKFRSELVWREFCHHLMFHAGPLESRNYDERFDAFPWRDDTAALKAWHRGKTGYPIVDAGMRELWQTGTMHNRVRMVCASFLTKHLLIDWRAGERWFWDALLDGDPGSNPGNWQWVAGCGADAAPYFRIFNPLLQGQKFDPDGVYVRRFVPELAKMPDRFVHAPWEAPEGVLAHAGVRLGESYPQPVVSHPAARARAIGAFAAIQSRG